MDPFLNIGNNFQKNLSKKVAEWTVSGALYKQKLKQLNNDLEASELEINYLRNQAGLEPVQIKKFDENCTFFFGIPGSCVKEHKEAQEKIQSINNEIDSLKKQTQEEVISQEAPNVTKKVILISLAILTIWLLYRILTMQ
ncbi:MAG: hypothetical protein KatS3mg101_1164 [Patescibacteria group bacterium]|nr:MAG: hypothetical protein KatS3mg101_1164 [Patescibacteria group bacterium]